MLPVKLGSVVPTLATLFLPDIFPLVFSPLSCSPPPAPTTTSAKSGRVLRRRFSVPVPTLPATDTLRRPPPAPAPARLSRSERRHTRTERQRSTAPGAPRGDTAKPQPALQYAPSPRTTSTWPPGTPAAGTLARCPARGAANPTAASGNRPCFTATRAVRPKDSVPARIRFSVQPSYVTCYCNRLPHVLANAVTAASRTHLPPSRADVHLGHPARQPGASHSPSPLSQTQTQTQPQPQP